MFYCRFIHFYLLLNLAVLSVNAIASNHMMAAVEFNGKKEFISMSPWIIESEFRVTAWISSAPNTGTKYLLSSSKSTDFVAIEDSTVYVTLNGQERKLDTGLNFYINNYIEITIYSEKIVVSDGKGYYTSENEFLPYKVTFDTMFKFSDYYSSGSLLSIAMIDISSIDNSRTIAFKRDLTPIVVGLDNIEVELIGLGISNVIHDFSPPNHSVSPINTPELLANRIQETYSDLPIVGLNMTEIDIGRVFAWEGYYWFRTYINLYDTTNDNRYLYWAVDLADFMFRNNDRNRALQSGRRTNTYETAPKRYLSNRNMFAPGWTQEYLHDGITVLVDGMILNGIMRLVDTIKENEVLELQEKADRYIAKSMEIIESHNSSWSEVKQDSVPGSWYYTMPNKVPLGHSGLYSNPLPFNHSLAMASAMILVDKWKHGQTNYKDKINKLIEFFESNLTINQDGSCVWAYSWTTKDSVRYEDINHGHIDVGFFVLADKNNYLKNGSVPACMAKTVVSNIAIGPGAIPKYVNGTGLSSKAELVSLSFDYPELAKYEPTIKPRVKSVLRQFHTLSWFRQYASLAEVLIW